MLKPKLKVADSLRYDYSEEYPKGTRIIYDSIRASRYCATGILVRVIEPFRRPVWLAATWLQSYHAFRDENQINDLEK